jgi:hypothetical protein
MADDPPRRKRVRSALADRMGFAWEPEELPDMTVEEAREMLDRRDFEREMGLGIGNEDSATYAHAEMLVAEAKGNA